MNITCADCGEMWDMSVVVSSEDWERIADDGAYMLCYRCMDKRAEARGITVKCVMTYMGKGLRTTERLPVSWRNLDECRTTGHPMLYGWAP